MHHYLRAATHKCGLNTPRGPSACDRYGIAGLLDNVLSRSRSTEVHKVSSAHLCIVPGCCLMVLLKVRMRDTEAVRAQWAGRSERGNQLSTSAGREKQSTTYCR